MPPEPLSLGGYTARKQVPFEPGGDILTCTSLALRQGETTVVLASTDFLTIPQSLSEEVQKRLPKGVHLFLHATHTHCAPDSQRLNSRMTLRVPGIASFQRKWLDWTADKLAEIIQRSLNEPGLQVSNLQFRNWTAKNNRGRRKYAQPYTGGAMIEAGPYALFSYAAHATLYDETELHTRQDWPGELSKRGLLVLNGAIGDVSPVATGETPAIKVRSMGEELFSGAMHARPQKALALPLAVITEPIELAKPVPHPTFAETYKVPPMLAAQVVKTFAPTHAKITAVRIGDVAIVGIPGEPSSELGRQIRQTGYALGFKQVLTISHVNGWIGYVLTGSDYDRGGYEATLGFYGREQGTRLVSAARTALGKLSRVNQ